MTAVSGKMLAIFALAAAGVAGCSSNSRTGPKYNPQIPTSWVSAGAVTNPFFPLVRGTTYEYEGQTSKELERIMVEVLNTTKVVNGVTTTVVRDRVYANGALIGQNVSVRLGNFSGCIVTADRNALEPGPVENKSYCRQVGLVQEVKAPSGQERVELVTKTP